MAPVRTILSGLGMPESVRCWDGRVLVADWTAGVVRSVGPSGADEVLLRHASLPLCFDRHPDGPVQVVSNAAERVLRLEADGTLTPWADLSGLAVGAWNEVVLTGPARGYVNSGNFDPRRGFPTPPDEDGLVVHVTAEAPPRVVARGLQFPNGMAVTADGATLLVAESHAARITAFPVEDDGGLGPGREWAALPGHAPDGIALDAEGTCWVADVPTAALVRVAEGGEVLRRIDLGRAAFSCALDGSGSTLYAAVATWSATALTDPQHVWDGALVAVDLGR